MSPFLSIRFSWGKKIYYRKPSLYYFSSLYSPLELHGFDFSLSDRIEIEGRREIERAGKNCLGGSDT